MFENVIQIENLQLIDWKKKFFKLSSGSTMEYWFYLLNALSILFVNWTEVDFSTDNEWHSLIKKQQNLKFQYHDREKRENFCWNFPELQKQRRMQSVIFIMLCYQLSMSRFLSL